MSAWCVRHNLPANGKHFTATIMLMRLCFLRERHREAAKQEQSSQHKYH